MTDGVLTGTIAGTLVPGEKPGKLCDKCTVERRRKPLIGMEILRGLRWNGDVWTGGEILDPDTGKWCRVAGHSDATCAGLICAPSADGERVDGGRATRTTT